MQKKTKIIIGIIIAVIILALFLIFVYPGNGLKFNGNATSLPARCSDSDGGLNYYVNGTVTAKSLGITKKYRDVCINSTTLKEMYCVIRKSDSIPDNKIYFCPGGCADGRCKAESGNLSDVPYSYLLIDEEGPFDSLQEIVDIANQYHVPLTISFWPGEVDYILQNQSRIDLVHQWQAQGHEVGIHNQGCWDGAECWNGSTLPECGFKYQYGAPAVMKPGDAEKVERLAAPYKVKSGNPDCSKWLPKTWVYEGGGRPDGRNAIVTIGYDSDLGHNIYTLNLKGSYAAVPPCSGGAEKIAQYKTLKGNEIFGVGFHTSDYTGGPSGLRAACLLTFNISMMLDTFGTTNCSSLPNDPELANYTPDKNQLLNYIKFIYEKDREGKKRMTLSDIMEKYVFPNNLTANFAITADSSNQKIKECSYVAYENIAGWQTTTAFNFGRCLQTGTYCAYEGESRMGIHAGAPIYCPNNCVVTNITDFDKSRSLAANCGDGNCTLGEDKMCPSDCTAGSKS